MKNILGFFVLFLMAELSLAQPSRHVVLISIDGLRPEMYKDKSWPSPNLQYLMKEGVYADHVKSVFPAYTYPTHVAMLTGAYPARSGVYYNQPKNSKGEWGWFTSDIKVPTLWQVLKKAGMTTSTVEWPVSVDRDEKIITWNIPEIWDNEHPEDRISESRKYATPGLIEEIEKNATGKLDSNTMSEEYFTLDEQSARMAGYIFMTRRPAFLAVHFALVDGLQHEYGRDHDSVRLALAEVDHAVGDVLEYIDRAKLRDSTTVIIVGDHGFCTINQVFRPNILLKDIPARFIAAGGSAFLYTTSPLTSENISVVYQAVEKALNSIPPEKRKLFKILDRKELDRLGADSAAIMALSAECGLVFSGSTKQSQKVNQGPGTTIQQDPMEGIFFPTSGGHHGYDPNMPEMYTGFIAAGAGIQKNKEIFEINAVDIAPLIAKLLGIEFNTPDGKLVPDILK
jgi:predicted AlkP superfamily pyrophosphatase or phosphodiesterase